MNSFFKVDGENLGEKPKWINDDYVKFLRFAQHKIGNNHFGICCMITPHGFIDNPTFREFVNHLWPRMNQFP